MATRPASENPFPELLLSEVAAPSSAPSGKVRLYAKSDGLLYWKDDAGTEYAIGTGDVGAHTADTTDAHDASAISAVTSGYGNSSGTDVQGVLDDFDAAITAGGGGGGGGYSPWDVPSAPNAADHEGDDASAFTGATDRASVSHAQGSRLLVVTKSSATGDRLAGTDWAETMGTNGDHVTVGLRDALLFQDYAAAGLYLCDSTFTAALSLALIHDGNGTYLQRKTWTNTGTGGGASANHQNPGMGNAATPMPVFLRIQRDSSATDYSIWASFGGRLWYRLASGLNPGFTVARAGIAAYSATNTIDVGAAAGFLRKNWSWGN